MSTSNGYDFKIHPSADLFPMMTAEELQELAADIAENGLLFPIMLDHAGDVLIDGRNRLAACELAKVKPRFERLADNEDPLAFIASVNLQRRNLTKGQQAMAMAMLYPDADERGRGKKGSTKKYAETAHFSARRVQEARSVLHHSRTLAESVLKGTKTFDAALAEVEKAKEYQQSDDAKLARLSESAPDLVEQVIEERLKINEALGALSAREQALRKTIDDGQHAARHIAGWFVGHVSAILAANESGGSITITAQEAEMIRSSYAVLFDRVPVSDGDE